MNPIKTASDYIQMPAKHKKKLVKIVLRKANEDQAGLVKRYDELLLEGRVTKIKL